MSLNNIRISEEKLRFLIGTLLRENNFQIIDFDLDIETYTPKTTTNETPSMRVSDYTIDITVDYNSILNGNEPAAFLNDFSEMLSLAYKSVSTYIIGNDGKITTETSDVVISDPMIMGIEYILEETHIVTLSFYVMHETD